MATATAGLRGLDALALAALVLLVGCVFAALHYAGTLAHRRGALLGTPLVLAVAVTVLENGMIVSMMPGGAGQTVARDSIFAALMIALNGTLASAWCFWGSARHFAQGFRPGPSNAFLAVLIPLAALTPVLPTRTRSSAGPAFTAPQLVFVACVGLTTSWWRRWRWCSASRCISA